MNMKKILSTALTVIMLFMAIAVIIPPVNAEAANSPSTSVSENTMSLEEIKLYISEDYLNYNFNTAEEMLEYDLGKGYLDSCTTADGLYSIYINRYTGFLYYRNNYTGEILTSNPTNPGYMGKQLTIADELMSQIEVKYSEIAVSTSGDTYNSVKWAANYGQISVSAISGGLRVSYTLGDTSTRFLLPGAITAADFTTDILTPMIESLEEAFKAAAPDKYVAFFGNNRYDAIARDGYIKTRRINDYLTYATDATTTIKGFGDNYILPIKTIINNYTVQDPAEFDEYAEDPEILYKKYPILREGTPIFTYEMSRDNALKRKHEGYIKDLCPNYTLSMMYDDERECGYVHEQEQKFVVRCALEYTFNTDGTLSVSLPANSISFDESVYTLESITPLKYFGYGDMSDEGFIFFPDGSGTVISFGDFYNDDLKLYLNLSLNGDVYGQDYCYSKLTGQHREQITMPVYGLVTQSNSNETTTDALSFLGVSENERMSTGYFAILEEGASLASLRLISGGSSHKFGNVYASYEPYPSDQYDLSQTLSVSTASEYTIVADSKYTGSYVTRIVMLSDDKLGTALYGENNYYNTTYVGMASYYRDYLKADGTLGALENADNPLPLYIESLGSMTIIEKFLTFPIEKSIPLTSFDDVITMYNQLSNATAHINSLIEDCIADAEVEEDELVKASLLAKAEDYRELLTQITDVKNVNFRLTGFANDGMYYTYPTKVKWERACGGKRGFEALVDESNRISSEKGVNFSIFPEFDFMYVSNTALFDGISKNKSLSRMVDNRYASKQVYNEVMQSYESFFTMVVSSDSLDELYSDFLKDYSKYNIDTLSVSTLGSDINSNFDKDNSINRDQSRENVIALLDRMANTNNYELMIDKGNIYSVKYASHILNVATDSSHFQLSSYAVPFVGMILHGHVSYAGSPINYSGSIDYEILRSIESGAAPYFILCYQNTAHLKDDEILNKYFGVNYEAWYSNLLITYNELNAQIGGLQDYEIVNHQTVIAERNKEQSELDSNYKDIEAEYLELLLKEIDSKLDATFDALQADAAYDKRVKLSFNVDAIIADFEAIVTDAGLILDVEGFTEKLNAIVAEYTAEYPGADEAQNVCITIDKLDEYESQYKYYTNSDCLAEDYEYTDYTLDNGKVVIVTYQKGDDIVRFVLNYNIYTVNVNINGEIVPLDKYEYKNLNELEVTE